MYLEMELASVKENALVLPEFLCL